MSAESLLEFVDTNILVYAHDRSAPQKQPIARELLERLWQNRNGCLSVQVLQEFYVVVTRKIANPLSLEEAESIIRDLSFWRVHSPAAEDVLSAIDLQRRNQINFWDAQILQSAARLGCSVIWSEDLTNDQDYNGVTVKNPYRSPAAAE